MAYCPECGSTVSETARFCSDCGHELDGSDADQGAPVHGDETDHEGDEPVAVEEPPEQDEPEPGPSPSTPGSRFTTGQKVLFAGVVLAGIGALLPWITASVLGTSVSVRGIEGDGTFSLVLALVAGGVGIFRWGRIAKVSIGVLGALVALLGLVYIVDPLTGVDTSTASNPQLLRQAVNPGIGLYVTLLGGLAVVASPIVDRWA